METTYYYYQKFLRSWVEQSELCALPALLENTFMYVLYFDQEKLDRLY